MAYGFSVILFLFLLSTGFPLTAGVATSKIEEDLVRMPSKPSVHKNALRKGKAPRKESADVQFYRAHCYATGNGVHKNKAEAIKWYQKAAAQGHRDAQLVLSVCAALYGL